MTNPLTPDIVLRDIEFEIIQGAVSQDDLGQGVMAVRRFQNKARNEVFEADRRAANSRDLAARQFQINDMLITLLQEMAARLQRLQVELRKATLLLPDTPPDTWSRPLGPDGTSGPEATEIPLPTGANPPTPASLAAAARQPVIGIENVLPTGVQSRALDVEPAVRPVRFPILGGLLTRLRGVLHSLPLFYVRRLARQQTAVNAEYGTWMLQMGRLCQQQQAQIEALSAQVAALQAHLSEIEGAEGGGTA